VRLAGDGAGAHPSRRRAAARAHAAAALVTAGLVLWNLVGLYYNLLWLVPFYTSPLVIHHYCGPGARPRAMANRGTRDLLADPRLRTALDLHRNRWR
jgi:hypothetical protein